MRLMDLEDYHLPINIGNPVEKSMLEIAALVLRLTGSSSTVKYLALPEDDPTRRRPDITKARSMLGWEPVVNLDEGLGRTIDYFRSVS